MLQVLLEALPTADPGFRFAAPSVSQIDFCRSRRPGTVGLFDDCITIHEIGKQCFCSAQRLSGRRRAMLRAEPAGKQPFVVDPRRPPPSPPLFPAVASFVSVVPAPFLAVGTVEPACGRQVRARIARNNLFGTATSAIWKITYRACVTTFGAILTPPGGPFGELLPQSRCTPTAAAARPWCGGCSAQSANLRKAPQPSRAIRV